MSWVVYRVLDADQRCIYAGMTSDLDSRRQVHLSRFDDAVEVAAYATFDEKWDAIRVESVLINAERPRHNVRDNPSHGAPSESDREKADRLVDQLVNEHLLCHSIIRGAEDRVRKEAVGDGLVRMVNDLREARAVMRAMAAGLNAAAEELA